MSTRDDELDDAASGFEREEKTSPEVVRQASRVIERSEKNPIAIVALASAQERLRRASGAFLDLLEERFAEWVLTPAERDVALFAIKGMSTAEISVLRATSEGTVKAQTNAIYRKAGVSGRSQLLSLFIDDLMRDDGTVRAAAQPLSAA